MAVMVSVADIAAVVTSSLVVDKSTFRCCRLALVVAVGLGDFRRVVLASRSDWNCRWLSSRISCGATWRLN